MKRFLVTLALCASCVAATSVEASIIWRPAKHEPLHDILVQVIRSANEHKIIDVVVAGTVHASVGAIATSACATGGTFVAGPIGAVIAGGVCLDGADRTLQKLDVVNRVGRQILGRDLDADALQRGRQFGYFVAGFAGGFAGGTIAVRPRVGSFVRYSREVRKLTERNIRRLPWRGVLERLRRQDWRVHHGLPVKCGWAWGLPAHFVAQGLNLIPVPARWNLRLGSLGC